MTPLEKARQLLNDIVTYGIDEGIDLPEYRAAKYSETPVVIPCECVMVAITGMDPPGPEYNPNPCNQGQVATFSIVIARSCSVEFDDDGMDEPEAVAKIAEQTDIDSQLLWSWVTRDSPPTMGFYTHSWSMQWLNVGTLMLTTLSLTTGVD